MNSSESNNDEKLRQDLEDAMRPPSMKERLGRPDTRKATWFILLLILAGLAFVFLPGGNDEGDKEETPEREHISKQRISLQDPDARVRDRMSGLVSPIVDVVTGAPSEPQLTAEEMARLEYLSFQIGGSIRVEGDGNAGQMQGRSMSGGSTYSQSGYGTSTSVMSVSNDTNASQTSDYGMPTVSAITATVRPQTLWHNDNRILEGKRMAAILETPVDTTLPGPVRAIFTEDVYSESGDRILIPRYSEALGTAGDVQIQSGQDRVGIAWHRLLLRTENGDGIVEVRLDSPATDALGRSGVKGNVKTHFWARFGNALLYTLIGTTASNVSQARSDSQNAQQAYFESTTDSFRETAQESLREQDVHQPTITVPRATTIMIVAAKDILFGEGQVAGVR